MNEDELQVILGSYYDEMKKRHEEEKQIWITMDVVRNLIEEVLEMKPFAVAGYPESFNEYNLGWQGAAQMLDSLLVTKAATGELWGNDGSKTE